LLIFNSESHEMLKQVQHDLMSAQAK